jgi:uncharacterized membrane protein (DUF106 family)
MTLRAIHGFRVPGWVATLSVLMAVVVTLAADRVGMAAQITNLQDRMAAVEKQHVAMVQADQDILSKLEEMRAEQVKEAVALQQIMDRQEEVRHVLRIR